MKIPEDLDERQSFYDDVIRRCMLSRSDRMLSYREWSHYYMFGAAEAYRAAYNKIQPTVELLRSFIYSAETTRFNIDLGASLTNAERALALQQGTVLKREINDQWHESDTDLVVGDAVTWSLVNGCMLVKNLWSKGGPQPYLVEPQNFGVFREDVPSLERQEAVVEYYTTTRSQLQKDLDSIEHPRRADIMGGITASATPGTDSNFPEGAQRIIISQTTPNMIGAANAAPGLSDAYKYRPVVDSELVGMYELRVWDDDKDDFRIVTQAEGGYTIFDRENFEVKKMLPYTKFCPKPLPFFFWGQSFVAALCPLQDWRTERMEQIKSLMSRALNPPKALTGATGIQEEKIAALFRARGQVSLPMGADVKEFAPKVPENVFAEIQQIDAMFEDMAGVSHVMQGKGESGVRAKGHADLLARLSSARPKQMALVIEDSLERQATMNLRLTQQHSEQEFQTEQGLLFLPKQFTNDFVVKVDAHSSSAIFIEDKKQDAEVLLEAHAIDRETFLDMFDPPGVQELKARLKVMEKQEAEQAQQKLQLEMQIHGKGKANA